MLVGSILITFVLTVTNSHAQTGKYVDSLAKAKNLSGTVVIERGGKVAYAKSFGLANRQFKTPNTVETRYKVASITKAFTSVLVLRLYERGKIDLNKPIRTYLPTYTGDAGDKVTVHQLLNHTSGIANIDRELASVEAVIKNGMPQYQTPMTSDQLLSRCASEKPVAEPGKQFDYNNADYIILGKIVEKLTGKPFERVLKDEILDPLRMQDSGMLYQYAIVDRLADTYFYREDVKSLTNDLPVYIENWYAAGAMYSTAGDILKFSDALFGGRLLKSETLDLMIKPGLDDYGYGVWSYQMKAGGKPHRIVKRPGRIMGAQSMLFRMPDDDLTIVILANTDAVDLDEFAAQLARELFK